MVFNPRGLLAPTDCNYELRIINYELAKERFDKARGAPYLASTLNITAFNLGNALGAFLGGLVVESSLGLGATSWAGALLTLAGVFAAAWSTARDRL